MYDIKPLEEAWKIYHQKRRRPWYLGFLTLGIIIVVGILIGRGEIKVEKMFFTDALSKLLGTKITQITEIAQSDMVIEGRLMHLETEKTSSSRVIRREGENTLVDIPLLDEEGEPFSPKVKVHLDIVESNSMDAYREVEKRFALVPDIDDALFLARSYYNINKYKKAEYWALETNKLDGDVEESLLIFVKAKLKLGQRDEALGILTTYIKKSDSEEAKNLLYQVKQQQ